MDPDPDDRRRRNRLAIAVVVGLVLVGAALGAFIGLVGSSVVRVLPDSDPTVSRPGRDGTSYPPLTPQPSTQQTSETTPPPETRSPRTPRTPRPGALTASPLQAGTFETIQLSGTLPGVPQGVQLQVQRKQGGVWTAFPVTATTQPGGAFTTSVETGQVGANVFRLTDPQSGRSTPPVTVQIG